MAFTSLFSLKSLVPLKSSSFSTCFLHVSYFLFWTLFLTANERRLLRPTTAASFDATHRRQRHHYRPTKFHDAPRMSTTPLPLPSSHNNTDTNTNTYTSPELSLWGTRPPDADLRARRAASKYKKYKNRAPKKFKSLLSSQVQQGFADGNRK